jgi:hypothetical protein
MLICSNKKDLNTSGILSELWDFVAATPIPGEDTRDTPSLYSSFTGIDPNTNEPVTDSAGATLPGATESIGRSIQNIIPIKWIAAGILGVAAIYLVYKFYPSKKK